MQFGMRLLACATLCVAWPLDLQASSELLFSTTSFAYSGRHSTAAMSPAAMQALRFNAEDPDDVTAPAAAGYTSPRQFTRGELCATVASVAEANNLPIPFFANLIQQESGFKPHVVSPAGAQGIAQFMPRVASAYGLTNPFDPIHALTVSGKFLRELVAQFGNVGLAAAAYNAGPKRVVDWMAKRGKLPNETRQYVQSITGMPAERWVGRKVALEVVKLPPHARCPGLPATEIQLAMPVRPAVKVAVGTPASTRKAAQTQFILAASGPPRKVAAAKSADVVATQRKPAGKVQLAAQQRDKSVKLAASSKKLVASLTKPGASMPLKLQPVLAKVHGDRKAVANRTAAAKRVKVVAAR